MKILDIINSPWAMSPSAINEMTNVYLSHLRGPKIDFKALGAIRDRKQRNFEVINNTAIIPVMGPLTPHSNFFSFFFGGTGMDDIKNDIKLAIQDRNDIILHIDSPGGTVAGAFELADFIKSMSENHSIIAFSDGQIASAAMLISSATNKTFITGKTNEIGSIGVYSRKVDVTKMYEELGINVDEFISGKFKNIGSQNRKTDEFEKSALQDQVDTLATLFVNDFSENMELEAETVAKWEAKIFIGKQAIDNKLVAGVATLEELLNDSDKGVIMSSLTLESFKAQNAELFNQIDSSAYQRGVEAGMISGKTEGGAAERTRISGIQSAAFPGQEALMKTLIDDGKTTAGEAAIQFNTAQKGVVAEAGKRIENEAVKPVETMEDQTLEKEAEKKDAGNLVMEYETTLVKMQADGKISKGQAMSIIKKTKPELHAAYIDAANKK